MSAEWVKIYKKDKGIVEESDPFEKKKFAKSAYE